jgi:hypothetical protein
MKDGWHTVVDQCHEIIGFRGDDRAGLNL